MPTATGRTLRESSSSITGKQNLEKIILGSPPSTRIDCRDVQHSRHGDRLYPSPRQRVFRLISGGAQCIVFLLGALHFHLKTTHLPIFDGLVFNGWILLPTW